MIHAMSYCLDTLSRMVVIVIDVIKTLSLSSIQRTITWHSIAMVGREQYLIRHRRLQARAAILKLIIFIMHTCLINEVNYIHN